MTQTSTNPGATESDQLAVAEPNPKGTTPEPLKPYLWKPGESGNPGGRPKGPTYITRLRRALQANDGKLLEELVQVAIDAAKKGSYQHLAMIIDRVDGPIATRVIIEAELDHMLDVAKGVLPHEHYVALIGALAAAPSSE